MHKILPTLLVSVLSFAVVTLVGCGWQLRGFNLASLPSEMTLKTADPYAPLPRQLQQTLIRRGVNLTHSADVRLTLTQERETKRTVAVTSIGSAAQYQLHLKIAYAYSTAADRKAGEAPTFLTIESQREFDFEAGSNLAKMEEEETLLTEMRQELIHRILAQSPQDGTQNAQPKNPKQ